MMTGRYEPTGFKSAPAQPKPQHRIEKRAVESKLLICLKPIREQFFQHRAAPLMQPRTQIKTDWNRLTSTNHQRLLSR